MKINCRSQSEFFPWPLPGVQVATDMRHGHAHSPGQALTLGNAILRKIDCDHIQALCRQPDPIPAFAVSRCQDFGSGRKPCRLGAQILAWRGAVHVAVLTIELFPVLLRCSMLQHSCESGTNLMRLKSRVTASAWFNKSIPNRPNTYLLFGVVAARRT